MVEAAGRAGCEGSAGRGVGVLDLGWVLEEADSVEIAADDGEVSVEGREHHFVVVGVEADDAGLPFGSGAVHVGAGNGHGVGVFADHGGAGLTCGGLEGEMG